VYVDRILRIELGKDDSKLVAMIDNPTKWYHAIVNFELPE